MRKRSSRMISALLVLPLMGALGLSSASAVPTTVLNGVSTGPAVKALNAAEKALSGNPTPDQLTYGATLGSHVDLTPVLATLQSHLSGLHGEDRARAEQILARPTDATGDELLPGVVVRMQAPTVHTYGTKHFVLHYVKSGTNRATLRWVKRTASTLEHVWRVEIGRLGFHPPKRDARGRKGRVDIYLANVGKNRVYGYCAADHPTPTSSGYCVLDNNFARSKFHTKPIKALRVTAAHEFFHEIQFGYRTGQARWFAEGSAVWMEDQVYDSINDYIQYVATSPIRRPNMPFTRAKYNGYGAFTIFTFLSEHYHDRGIVRNMWSRVAKHHSPIKALNGVLAAHHSKHRNAIATYGVWNTLRSHTYPERKLYRPVGWWKSRTLKKSRHGTGWLHVRVKWLSTAPLHIKRGKGVGKHRKVVVTVDGPSRSHKPAVMVQVRLRNGAVKTSMFHVGKRGKGTHRFGFGKKVSSVVVTLTNTINGNARKFRVRAHLK